MRIHLRAAAGVAALSVLVLTGCTVGDPPSTGADHASPAAHVHAIVANPAEDGFLLGTHEGIYTASADGQLGGRVSDVVFDAMGLTAVGGELLASGHPGSRSPAEWGTPNLGIIRSTDAGQSWESIAFPGEKDFHALAAGPAGTVFGVASDSVELLASEDRGETWSSTGASLLSFAMAVDATGRVIAVTSDGLQVSANDGASFSPWSEAPSLVTVSTSRDHQRVVGVDTKERIWVTTAGAQQWTQMGTVHGTAQAIAITDTGDILVVDDSGISSLPANNEP